MGISGEVGQHLQSSHIARATGLVQHTPALFVHCANARSHVQQLLCQVAIVILDSQVENCRAHIVDRLFNREALLD